MPRRARTALTVLLAAALAAPGVAAAQEGGAPTTFTVAVDEGSGTDNLTHVTNLAFEPEVPGGSFRATDLDFASYRVRGGEVLGPAEGDDEVDDTALEAVLGSDGRRPTLPDPARGGRGLDRAFGTGGVADEPGDDVEVRDFAFVGTALDGLQVVDITDREAPEVVARYDCRVSQADVFVFRQGERTLAAYTLDAVSQNQPVEGSTCHADNGLVGDQTRGTFLIDLSDPYAPESVSFLPMRKGTHQVTVHPSGQYVYNSAAVLVTTELGSIEVYDIGADATPEEPVLVDELQLLTGLDSHDLTFNADGTRLYSAALTHSLIVDTSDPTANEIVGRVVDPAINIHHDAHAVTVDTPYGERDFLFIGDELAGAAGTGLCPGGGIHVFDITGDLERLPVKVGAFFIPEVAPTDGPLDTCTAHVLDVLEDEQLISIAWYNAGVRVLDYSGLADLGPAGLSVGLSPALGGSLTPGIQEVGHRRFADSDLWSAKVFEVEDDGSFYIYGGDIRRSLDVFRFEAGEPVGEERGSWLGPLAAWDRAASLPRPDPRTLGDWAFRCLVAGRRA